MTYGSYPYGTYPYPLRRKLLSFSPLWPARIMVYRHDGDDLVHDHDFIEIAVILEGEGIHNSIHGELPVKANDVFILRPGAWHGYQNCKGLQVFNCIFGSDFLEQELHFVSRNPLLNYLFWTGPLAEDRKGILAFHLAENAQEGCRNEISGLMAIDSKDDPQSRIKWLGHFILMLHHMVGSLESKHHTRGLAKPRSHEVVQNGIELLHSRMAHEWTLQELASQLYISPSYLLRLFKEDIGIPPLTYLARYRAEQAAILLLRSDKSIATIGTKVGWGNPSYFSKRFKSHFGLTAGEYRERFSSLSPHDTEEEA
jgi:AraC family L-rhamnose operon transcriptional activator RhaR